MHRAAEPAQNLGANTGPSQVYIPDHYRYYTRNNVLNSGFSGSTGALLDEPLTAPYIGSDVVISLRRQMLEQQHHHSTEILRLTQKLNNQQKVIDGLQQDVTRNTFNLTVGSTGSMSRVPRGNDTFENEEYNASMTKLQNATIFRHIWPSSNPLATYSSTGRSAGGRTEAKITDWDAFRRVVVPLGLLVHLKQAFIKADQPRTGHLDIEKLGRWVQTMGMKYVTYSQLQAMIQQVDTNSNGTVEWWEFVGMQVYLNFELNEFDLKQWMLFCTQVYIPQGAGLWGHTITQ